MKIKMTAVFQKVPAGFVGFVEELPGANTQGETLDEARANLLDANRTLAET
ncbi:MAG: type II toxin-antitoxin system HicB family antitoxin [Planctomycetes bacterium]|nr:type II toxin-antitoxin system HicB family antitoxin [Planctomycetota bacterium]